MDFGALRGAEALRALRAALLELPREISDARRSADGDATARAASAARAAAAGRALQTLKERCRAFKSETKSK